MMDRNLTSRSWIAWIFNDGSIVQLHTLKRKRQTSMMADPFASLDPIKKPRTQAELILESTRATSSPRSPSMNGNVCCAPVQAVPVYMDNMASNPGAQALHRAGIAANPVEELNTMPSSCPNPFGSMRAQPAAQEPALYEPTRGLQQPTLENTRQGDGCLVGFGNSTHIQGGETTFTGLQSSFSYGAHSGSINDFDVGFLETGLSVTKSPVVSNQVTHQCSPASSNGRSSALTERLANSRRQTQEMQRAQLGFKAEAFAQSRLNSPKICLKGISTSVTTAPVRAMAFDEFASS